MQFLVEIKVDLPPDLRDPESSRRNALLTAGRERGLDLRRNGAIERIWRVPGQRRNVAVWNAEDATELHDLITSLPLAPWLEAEVIPLAEHPVESAFRSAGEGARGERS